METNFVRKKPFRKFNKKLVGAHESVAKPQLPKRDDIVSKGKTPEQKEPDLVITVEAGNIGTLITPLTVMIKRPKPF